MLHITNGDCTSRRLTGYPGLVMEWCDILHHGPAPAGLSPREWRETRAAFHAELGFGSAPACLAKLTAMDEGLREAPAHDEIVLWYEHDLFDQLILLRLLHEFAGQHRDGPPVSVVNIEDHARNRQFRGLAELPDRGMQIAFQDRRRVSAAQFALAARAWNAFTCPDPREVEKLRESNTPALPFLGAALYRHLQEFPSLDNGLSLTRQLALEVLQEGPATGRDVFRQVQQREDAVFLGDTTFFALLLPLARAGRPLLKISNFDSECGGVWELLPTGRDVLEGRADWVELNGIDEWRGGCHLHSGVTLWRFDAGRGRLVADDCGPSAPKPVIC